MNQEALGPKLALLDSNIQSVISSREIGDKSMLTIVRSMGLIWAEWPMPQSTNQFATKLPSVIHFLIMTPH